jgi:hypothetical protein
MLIFILKKDKTLSSAGIIINIKVRFAFSIKITQKLFDIYREGFMR